MAIDDPIQRGTPAGNSQFDQTKMGQKMALVHQKLSLPDNGGRHADSDDDFELTDEELAIVVGQQSKAADACAHPDGELDYVPLRIMRPDFAKNGQEKHRGSRYKHGATKTSTDFTKTYKRKRVRPAGSKSAKSKLEQKLALVDSTSHNSSDIKRGKDDDFERSDKDDDFQPMRKRGRPAGYRSAKSKKRTLVFRSSSSEGKKDKDDDFEPEVSDDDDQKKYARVKDFYGSAWDRAVKLNEKLPADGPSFAKLMLKSHVVRGFWLGLPVSFCRNYLPEHDVKIELEDEEGRIYDTNYLDNKKGLSGGWNGFAQKHDLNVGDAVVFQLVRPTRFKVYILRDNRFSTIDGALTLLSLDTSKENNISEEHRSDDDVESKEDPEVTRLSRKGSGDDSNDLASEEAADDNDIRSSDTDTGFSAVKNLGNFKIVVAGSVVNRKLLPARVRTAYYKLCCARKAFLHRHLLKGINPTLAAGVIVETVNIAEGIRASHTSSSSLEDLAAWKKTLESLELLGMDVAFMRKRVDDLLALPTPSRDHLQDECEGYEEVKLERDRAAEKMRALEARMSSLKDALVEMDVEMKEIMVESSARKTKDRAMRRLAAAPW